MNVKWPPPHRAPPIEQPPIEQIDEVNIDKKSIVVLDDKSRGIHPTIKLFKLVFVCSMMEMHFRDDRAGIYMDPESRQSHEFYLHVNFLRQKDFVAHIANWWWFDCTFKIYKWTLFAMWIWWGIHYKGCYKHDQRASNIPHGMLWYINIFSLVRIGLSISFRNWAFI
jgi:hypothetical protein